jgi:hypothetical protein
MNATQAPILQHDQIQTAADYLQLISLKAVAKQFAVFAIAHFCDQGFIAGKRLVEERGTCSAGTRRDLREVRIVKRKFYQLLQFTSA